MQLFEFVGFMQFNKIRLITPLERDYLDHVSFKGTVSRDFLFSVFSPKQLLLFLLEMSYGRFDFFAYWLSYKHFKMTPRCLGHWGVAPKIFSKEDFSNMSELCLYSKC